MVCDMTVSESGRIGRFRFYEAIIRSHARLTYTRVAAHLEGRGEALPDAVTESLGAIHELYRTFRAEREARGALDFDAPEQKLVLDNGLLERIVPVVRNDAHRLIEEAMIAANVCAAKFLAKADRRLLYRVHEGPTIEKWEDLRAALALVGIRVGKGLPGVVELKRIVDLVAARPDRALLETLVLRSMSQAVYSPRNLGHFGLALPHYAHFTSPIRRYADLLVHRSIKSVLREDGVEDEPHLGEIGEHISYTERRADEVSRAVADWLKCEFAAGYVGETFLGTVVSVAPFGLFVELDRIFVQGLLHISNLGNDYFEALGGGLAIVGTRSGLRFSLGDRFEVVLADVNVEERKIDLLLPDGHRRGGGRSRRGRR
jgi:ribonuclease R